MPVDNELYNRFSETWWDENAALSTLRTWLNPVRFGYFRRVLIEEQRRDPQRTTVLDVGCGGGLLAEEFARLGCQVTGIDPSEASLETARKHARQSDLNIAYQAGRGEQLPFATASFDLVVCCDVLEHVNDVSQVIKEIARVLALSGLFFYDTINRTVLSWLAVVKIAQEWRWTCIMPPNLHDWKQFIKPQKLQQCMQQYQLQNQEVKGMHPTVHPLQIISLFIKHKRGKITLTEMGRRLQFQESHDLSASYLGYALKEQHI